MDPLRSLLFLIGILSLGTFSFCDTLEELEKDFRYISHKDLMASGSERFTDEGVTSYGQLHFDVARDQLFVGARDTLYRLSLRDLSLLEKAAWPAPHDKVTMCQDKGQSESACHNYVKVLLSDGERLFTCGTNAFSPQCSYRQLDRISEVLERVDGVAKCPYSPDANITSLMTMDGQYFVGSPTDFSGSDSAIHRSFGKPPYRDHPLRTNQYNSKWLNAPQFVGSFEDDKFVYFVFREAAVEYINCGKRIFSRIARVCKNDNGGQIMLRDNWTSFVKARLNCSLPGEYPFYYDEVQGVEYLPEERLLYATFTTPSNSIAGSAICVFNMSSIERAFSGPFKHQEHPNQAWERRHTAQPFHMQCDNAGTRGQQLADSSRYQLMDDAVQASSLWPLHTAQLERYSWLTVAVLANSHLLFVATQAGLVKKLAVLPGREDTCLIEIWRPEADHLLAPIKTMQYLKETDSVYLGSEEGVLRVPASRCGRHASRAACLGAQDPLCGWDEARDKCLRAPLGPKHHWHQAAPACPDTTMPVDGGWSSWSAWEVCNQKPEQGYEERLYAEEGKEQAQDKCLCQTRQCNNPAPKNGGKSCQGASVSVTNCTVHGGWTAWSGWSACSASCGLAVKSQRRSCGAPAPQHGGRLCVGPDRMEIYCTQTPPCPVPVPEVREAVWSSWGPWSVCSSPCGGGARWRSRRCDSPAAEPCRGCAQEHEPCNTQPCPNRRTSVWTPWLAVPNNSSDVGYVEKRFRYSCRAAGLEPIKISLTKEEERYCRPDGSCGAPPGTEAGWSPWGEWDACSAACGGGYQTATRSCLMQPCEGSSKMQRACNTHSCIDGWGCWSEWSACSSSCGFGRRERRRSCLLPAGCEGDSSQIAHCEGPPCQSFLGWGAWSEWSPCFDDEQERTRVCLLTNKLDGSEGCQGANTETRRCSSLQMDNDISVAPAYSPKAVVRASMVGGGDHGGGGLGLTVGLVLLAFLGGVLLTAGVLLYCRRRSSPGIPSSPHYLSQQNSYVSVPLKEVPKKRQPSFSGLTLSKANNIASDRTHSSLGTPKLYPKAMAADYDSATIKRNSNGTCKNNLDLEQEKFY